MSDTSLGGRVLVAGAINTDLVVQVRRAPAAGETVTGQAFAIFGGGKGANQAVAAARSGATTSLLGAVGRDDFGRQRLADLEAEGIETGAIGRREDAPSGVALIIVESGGENRIAYVPGATLSVTADDAKAAFERARPAAVLATLELPPAALEALLRAAKQRGATVLLNATPEPAAGADLLSRVDVLVVNETEAAEVLALTDQHVDWAEVATALVRRGPAHVVITLGEAGAIVATAEHVDRLPAPRVEVVDTTGAGDAFCGALAAALAAGSTVLDAARIGVVAGALAVTKAGAQPSQPYREEIERLLAHHPRHAGS